MGKKTGVFTEGQHVYAKVKGYSPWPAKITKVIAKHRYGVYFYGTGETASVKSEDLDPYDSKSIARFNTDRQLKKSDYKEAVDQIEQALAGNDPAPLNPEEKEIKTSLDFELSADNITDNDNSADESQLQIAEETPKSTPVVVKKKTVVAKPKIEIFTPEPEAKENDEKVSRSGRKIKEKKMNMDEVDPDEMFTQPRKRFKIEEPKTQKSRDSAAIEEFRASKMHILQDPIKKNLLENQYEMLNTIQEIKMALGLGEADIERAVELLDSFREKNLTHITDLMLLKYPNTVESVKRLKKYIGNLNSWGMEESQVEKFQQKAEKIRAIATVVYDHFKSLFSFPEDANFWAKFADEQKTFNEKYNVLNKTDLFEGLSFEELDSFINNQSTGDVEATAKQDPEVEAEAPEKELETDKTVVDEPMEVAEPVN